MGILTQVKGFCYKSSKPNCTATFRLSVQFARFVQSLESETQFKTLLNFLGRGFLATNLNQFAVVGA